MYLETVLLRNFRNYQEAKLSFHAQNNIIYGANAEGKSNLLEAIGYLSLATSFRDGSDRQLLRWDAPFFYLQGNVIGKNKMTQIAAGFDGKKKIWKIDGQAKRKLSEVLGNFYTVFFCPDDLQLVKASPQIRRRFLNREMVQLQPSFCHILNRYHKVLQQRNRLLMQGFAVDQMVLASFEEQLAELAAEIYDHRLRFLQRMNEKVYEMHMHLSKEKEQLQMAYSSFLPQNQMKQMDQQDLKKAFLKKLKEIRPQEMKRQTTLLGPQRDDLLLFIDGKNAKQFASQGQMRTIALSLKLSELSFIEEETGEYPALLLDDVMSELDLSRREQLLHLLDGKVQTFITTTDINFQFVRGKQFFVENGSIIEK